MNEIEDYKKEIELQKKIAYSAGLLQGDVTIKTLLESLAEGVVIINELGRIIIINNRFSQLTGYTKQEVMGESLDIFMPESVGEAHKQHLEHFFSQPRIRPMGVGMELVALRKDKTLFPVEISLSFLKTETEKLGLAFITDISSRKKAEDELRERNKELDHYARTVAHDLNSPLLGLIGLSELLIDSENEINEDERKDFLKKIAEGGRSMSNVIKEMLIFATLKKDDVNIMPVDMISVIDNTLKRLRFQIAEATVQINIQENIPNCCGYSPWIEEIWFNYLSNAIKYEGPSPIIEIGFEKIDKDSTKYFVKDQGSGINNDLASIIFQDNNIIKDKYTIGSGLGLAIVKNIIEKLDGSVDVESEPGKGAKFSFILKSCPIPATE